MARGKKKEEFTLEEKLEQALVPVEEQPYEVPENWCWVYQNVACQLGDGEKRNDEEHPYLEVKYLRGSKKADIKKTGKYIKTGTKIILVDGENSGEVFVVSEDGYMGSTFKILDISCGVNEKYLLYFVNSKKDLLRNNKTGSAIPHLNKKLFFSLGFPLPPLEEQRRIVKQIESFFAKLDEAKEKLEDFLRICSERRNAILQKAYSGILTEKWRQDHVDIKNCVIDNIKKYSMNLSKRDKKFIEDGQSKLKEITMSSNVCWFKGNVGAVSIVTNGSTPSRKCDDFWNGDIPWVSSGEVRNNVIAYTEERITQEGYDNSSVKLLPIGTVLIAMIGEGKTRGQSAILNIEAAINQNIAAIVIEHGQINSKFLWYWLQKQYKKNREKGAGSGPQALNCQRVRELDFIIPPLEEQNEIVKIIDNLLNKESMIVDSVETTLENIESIRKSILAKAFRGELGTNHPSEEAAIGLLKTILAET